MKSNENIVFLGMMGSGKTSMGLLISKKLNLNFFDTDQNIEKETGMKISRIFETKGEKFFRNCEEKITLKILKKSNAVISLGGGAFINKKIQKEILTNHMSIWLRWDSETLIKRINKSYKRPIAINSSKEELKKFNYSFQNNIKRINEMDNQPAYKRLGYNIDQSVEDEKNSPLTLDKDKNDEVQLRSNNSFLHDNVD